MSQAYARGNASDLNDDSINRNEKFAKAHPFKKNISITIAACWKCHLCGWLREPGVKTCPDCGSPAYRAFEPNQMLDLPLRNEVAQFKRPIQWCWNIKEDPISGDISRHLLVEGSRLVVDLPNQEAHQESYCKECLCAYGYSQGRVATTEEIEKAKAGKIPGRAKLVMGRGS